MRRWQLRAAAWGGSLGRRPGAAAWGNGSSGGSSGGLSGSGGGLWGGLSGLGGGLVGGDPVSATHVTSAPNCCNPSIKSAMGRSLIRGTPSNINLPFPIHKAAANGLMAVPALPKNNSITSLGVGLLIGPSCPVTETDVASPLLSRSTGTCNVSKASSMYRISSDSNKFSTRVVPDDKAASRRQRLESDLDPGRVTVPSSDLMGVTVS